MLRVKPVYEGLCPNCGGLVSYERLISGLPCSRCLPSVDSINRDSVLLELERSGRLAGLRWVLMLEREFKLFAEYFRSKTGVDLWSAQASWAKRLLGLDSFTIIAPTGVGKTTLLSVYAAYRFEVNRWRILYLVPTGNLARQVYERIRGYVDSDRILAYYSTLPAGIRGEVLERVGRGEFNVLIATTGFLQRRFEELRASAPFNLVVVDDVDSMLRDSRNVDRVLVLLGYTPEVIEIAENLVKNRVKFVRALAMGDERLVEELTGRIAGLESALREALRDANGGQLVVASATGRPRGLKHLIFKELLSFEVGGGGDYLRNVIDSYLISSNPLLDASRMVERLGPGGIVYVSQYLGRSVVNDVVKILEERGLRVGKALSGSWGSIAKLERGEIDILVSIASRYGVAVRGLDAPRVVKYTVFIGVPALSLTLEDALVNPRRLLRVLIHMRDEGVEGIEGLLRSVREVVESVEDPTLIAMALRRGKLDGRFKVVGEAYNTVLEWVKRRLTSGGRLRIGSMVLVESNGDIRVYVPDALTYIQASGRASRLLDGRMTLGFSVIVEPLLELVRALEERLRLLGNFTFRNVDGIDLDHVRGLLEHSRSGGGRSVKVKTVLVVVESPTKAKTIAWFWGRPSKRRVGRLVVYETSFLDVESGEVYLAQVTATRGHLFDLVEEASNSVYGVIEDNGSYTPIYGYIRRCRSCGHQFTRGSACPRCNSEDVMESKLTIDTLRKLALEVDEVIVATDPDIEGEKIAWDIYVALKPYNGNVRRAKFNEVTRDAVIKAIREAGSIDVKLVEAQITRRVIDRWVGFIISEHLQKTYGYRWLGAGRVQSPVLSWIVDRYNEWLSNKGYSVCFKLEPPTSICVYTRSREEARRLSELGWITVSNVDFKIVTLNPLPPYTTDTLLYDASRRLGLTAEKTMRIAQELFEAGLITYHRTDSTRVSTTGISIARVYMEGKGLLGEFKPRSWGEGGAHEAIRPTKPLDLDDLDRSIADGTLRIPFKLTWAHRVLYDIIFRRFMASQMSEAEVVKALVEFDIEGYRVELETVGEIRRAGYMKIYQTHRVEPWVLGVTPGLRIQVREAVVRRASMTQLYTTGDLVRLMKEMGIGRPSTYHKAIEANRRHGYVILSRKRGYVIPTRMGLTIANYLKQYFKEITSEEYTRDVEEKLTLIESDSVDPNMVLKSILETIRERVEGIKSSSV